MRRVDGRVPPDVPTYHTDGWVNVAVGGRGTGAEEHLAMVLRYVGAVAVDGACVRVPVPREAAGPDGIITDPAIRTDLGAALAALAEHAGVRPAAGIDRGSRDW